jgi:oxygen-dependent protoporphyrinogen oxidase
MSIRTVDAVIVGGGISGASLLHWMSRDGADVLLLERGSRLGGVIGSSRNGHGALVETGPNGTQLTNPQISELIDDLGISDQVLRASDAASNRYVMRDGKLHSLPTDPRSFLRTKLFSASARLRLVREPFIRPSPADAEESIAQFVERRLGREFLDYAINPFVAGIYAGRPERLSVRHAFPKLHALEQEYKSLIRGAIGKRKERKKGKESSPAKDRAAMISFVDGMQTLPLAIQQRWGERVRTGTAVQTIERSGDGWRVVAGGDAFETPTLIVATDAFTAADLLAGTDPELAIALRRIEYPPVATAVSMYRRDAVAHPLDGFGLLIPQLERRSILGIIFSSTIYPNRTPEGFVLLTTFIGGARQPELALRSREEIEYDVHRELQRTLGISARPHAFSLNVWPHAIPQYNIGYGEILGAIEQAEGRHRGLHLLGNYRGGVSVADCVRSASLLAEQVGVKKGDEFHIDQ